jgi:hypothetical protein
MDFTRTPYDTPVPISNLKTQTATVDDFGRLYPKLGESLIQLSLRRKSSTREIVYGFAPKDQRTLFMAIQCEDTLVRGCYAMNDALFLTGSSSLRDYLSEPDLLDRIVGALVTRRDARTGSVQVRFAGPLGCCLMRRAGRWTELTQRGQGPLVVGIDAQESMAYAINLRGADKPLAIVSGQPSMGGIIKWDVVSTGPEGKYLLDASRFVRDARGNVLAMVELERNDLRLLTLMRDKVYWSESCLMPGAPIEAMKGAVLAQRWAADGYLVSLYPTSFMVSLPSLAYAHASG